MTFGYTSYESAAQPLTKDLVAQMSRWNRVEMRQFRWSMTKAWWRGFFGRHVFFLGLVVLGVIYLLAFSDKGGWGDFAAAIVMVCGLSLLMSLCSFLNALLQQRRHITEAFREVHLTAAEREEQDVSWMPKVVSGYGEYMRRMSFFFVVLSVLAAFAMIVTREDRAVVIYGLSGVVINAAFYLTGRALEKGRRTGLYALLCFALLGGGAGAYALVRGMIDSVDYQVRAGLVLLVIVGGIFLPPLLAARRVWARFR